MAEQNSASTPSKPSDEVKTSSARSEAERSSHSSSSGPNLRSQSQTRASFGEGGDSDSLVGKSLEYTSGVGYDGYPKDGYATDVVNSLPHLAVHFDR